MLGIMPSNIYLRGSVGVVSRSGTLGYEAGAQMKALGIGVTTSVGIGGDPINGSSFLDHLMLFEEDPETKAVIIIGEIGGPQATTAYVVTTLEPGFARRLSELATDNVRVVELPISGGRAGAAQEDRNAWVVTRDRKVTQGDGLRAGVPSV